MEKSLDQREYEIPSKREEVVMDDFAKAMGNARSARIEELLNKIQP